MQNWERYISDEALERYLGIFTSMLERYEAKGLFSPAYRASVRASLERVEAEYERRIGA